MHEARYSANFRKYLGETDFQFTVRGEETADQHLDSVIQYAEACGVKGFRDKPGAGGRDGLAEGEDSWPVDGYVIGRVNQRDGTTAFVVWLYGKGKFRHTSVYPEKWNDLWFTPNTSKVWPVSMAPGTDEAKSSGFLIPVPERNVIRESWTDREGNLRRKFSRVAGAAGGNGQPASPPVQQQAPPQQPEIDPEVLADRFVNAAQTNLNTVEQLVRHGNTAIHRKADFGNYWIRINNVLKSKVAVLRLSNNISVMTEAIDSIREAFGPFYDEVKRSLTPQQEQNHFVVEDPEHGFVPF